MAPPKRGKKSSLQNPLPASSSQDDEEVENVLVEEEEQLQEVSTVKKPIHPKTQSSDDDEEEDQDEEESDSKRATIPKLKPTVSKPKKTNSKAPFATLLKPSAKKPNDPKIHSSDDDEEVESDSEPATPPKLKPKKTPLKPSMKKHPLECGKDSKRKKKKKKVEAEEEVSERSTEKNNVLFSRIWSEEDEIVILKGMIKSKKKGIKPFSDLSKFLESLKKSLHVEEFSQDQLKNKIKRLKKKYMNNSRRAKGNEDPFFSKPHEQQLYTLMKELWDGENSVAVATDRQRSSVRIRKSVNANDFDQKLRSLNVAELKLYLRRLDLVYEQTVAILDAYKLSGALEHE